MNKIKYLFVGLVSSFILSSCLDSYKDLNTDDEQLGTVEPKSLFTGATLNFNNNSRAWLTDKYSGTMIYMQYLVSTSGASADNYINLSTTTKRPQPSNYVYSDYYSKVGLQLDNLINTLVPKLENPEQYNDIVAISKILMAYEQWRMLDTYGAAPITEALKAQSEGIRTPRYDLFQKSINGEPMYKVIDQNVKDAIATLKASDASQSNLGSNDFFYGGDVTKWIKFANSFRIKLAQRLEKADSEFYNSVINEVLTSADNIIASNAESCIYNHTNDYNNDTNDIENITKNYTASRAFVDFLKAHNDPRLPILLRRNGFGDGNNNSENDTWFETFKKQYPNYASDPVFSRFTDRYQGMSANPDSANSVYQKNVYLTLPYKQADGTEANLDIRMYSQAEGRYFVKNGGRSGTNMPVRAIEDSEFIINQDKIHSISPVITYPEMCFTLAEIALKKGSSVAGKSADQWYKDGIKSSIEQYRDWAVNMYVVAQVSETAANFAPVTDANIAEYLARPEFQTATLEKIISQQWINLYVQPEEMWATWKRTGLPKFQDVPQPNNGVAYLETIQSAKVDLVIPRRNSLSMPNTLNIENYYTAIEQLKSDEKYGVDNDRTEGRIWWDMP